MKLLWRMRKIDKKILTQQSIQSNMCSPPLTLSPTKKVNIDERKERKKDWKLNMLRVYP